MIHHNSVLGGFTLERRNKTAAKQGKSRPQEAKEKITVAICGRARGKEYFCIM